MNNRRLVFNLTWLTTRPLLKGHKMAIWIGMIPVVLSIVVLAITASLDRDAQGPGLCSSAIFISLGAVIIQSPAFVGRVELLGDQIIILDRSLGKRSYLTIPQQTMKRVFYTPLTRPAHWLPYIWAAAELIFLARVIVSSPDGGIVYWYWLTVFVSGLSFWPLMAARWKATCQVILLYQHPNEQQPGVIRAWTTPHQANSLVNTLRGLIDWEKPRVEEK